MTPPFDQDLYACLEQRVGRAHLRQRLGIERDFEARIFGQGRNFFHIENWYSIHGLIRGLLRSTMLHRRGRRNARTIRKRHNFIHLPALPPAFDGYRILHISDLHLDMAEDMPHVLIEAVRDLEYDLCVLTGDYRAATYGPWQAAIDGLAQLRPHLNGTVFGILGNHDSIRMVPAMEALGIRMLLNESVPLERSDAQIYLAGIDDPHFHRADNLEKTVDGIPDDRISILLAHSPEIYRHAAWVDFDVMLCGHTHGGQICLPGGIPLMCNANAPRKYCRGRWRYRQLQGYTSPGSGACIVDVRFNCPPEVTLHTLVRAQQG